MSEGTSTGSDSTQIELYFERSQVMLTTLYPDYRILSKSIIKEIPNDKSLSSFHGFNTRLKMTCGLEISFSDNLGITKKDTRACYMLMIKLSDLWFAFEHLTKLSKGIIEHDASPVTSVNHYSLETQQVIGLNLIVEHFNLLFDQNVRAKPQWRRELYKILGYLINNTKGGTKNALKSVTQAVKSKEPLEAKHLFALCYGLRNIYVHKGVTAALGTKDYSLKRRLYTVLYDSVVLSAFSLGSAYCREYAKLNLLPLE